MNAEPTSIWHYSRQRRSPLMWSLQMIAVDGSAMPGVFSPRCLTRENIAADVDEVLWADQDITRTKLICTHCVCNQVCNITSWSQNMHKAFWWLCFEFITFMFIWWNSCVYCFDGRNQFWKERTWFWVLCFNLQEICDVLTKWLTLLRLCSEFWETELQFLEMYGKHLGNTIMH